MSEQTSEQQWLTVPDLATEFDLSVSRIRRMIEERYLLAVRVDGVLKVPASFVKDGEPVHNLRGTLILLGDAGFDDEEAVRWMLEPEESIGIPPIEALRAGRRSEVRRVAQALA